MNKEIVFPAKISGFYTKGESAPPTVSVESIENQLEKLEQLGFSKVDFADFSKNKKRSYHLALVEKEKQQYFIFFNKFFPYVAISEIITGFPVLEIGKKGELAENQYVDIAELDSLLEPNFILIPKHVLEVQVDADNEETASIVVNLTDYEFAEFSFWEPKVMGDIVFNNWG